MSVSIERIVALLNDHIKKGEPKRAQEIVEELLQNDPENVLHYLLMAYFYLLVGDHWEKRSWIEEVLRREPENENFLEMIIGLLDMEKEEDFALEIVKTGLRLYPKNSLFHLQYAELLKNDHQERAKISFEEAVRVQPQSYLILGRYAIFLYQVGEMDQAEQYEQQCLSYHSEDTQLLTDFARIAYQRKKYNKAQYLIDEAIRLDPNNEYIRKCYELIYPTKNRMVRSTEELNDLLARIFLFPAHFVWRISKGKISYTFLFFTVLLLEWIGLHHLFGNYFYLALGMYLVILVIHATVKKSMLKKIGFTDDAEAMKKKTEATQQVALKEMQKEVLQRPAQTSRKTHSLSQDELERRLADIWKNDNIASLREQTAETAGTGVAFTPAQPTILNKQRTTMEMPKEDSKWRVYPMITAVFLAMALRFVPYLTERANQPKPIDPELKEWFDESRGNLNETDYEALYSSEEVEHVEQFLQQIDSEQAIDYVATSFRSALAEHRDHPVLSSLEHAQIDTVIQPHRGLSIYYFLVINEAEDIHVIIEVTSGEIRDLYAEDWSETDEGMEKYHKLMKQLQQAKDEQNSE